MKTVGNCLRFMCVWVWLLPSFFQTLLVAISLNVLNEILYFFAFKNYSMNLDEMLYGNSG